MSASAWADVAGPMETAIATSVYSANPAGATIGAVRDSLYEAVLRMFADPRCGEETKALVREYVTGEPK